MNIPAGDGFTEWQAGMRALLGPELSRAFDERPELDRWHLYGISFCLYPDLRKEMERLATQNANMLQICKMAIAYMNTVSSDADHFHAGIMKPLRDAVTDAERGNHE